MIGCNSVKNIPDGDYLLDRVIIDNNARNIGKESYVPYLSQKPNVQIFGMFKFHLWLYNLAGKDTTKGFNNWLKRIGEAPILYDSTMVESSSDNLQGFLANKGYFHGEVSDTLIVKRNKKVKVKYTIDAGDQYVINDVGFKAEDSVVHKIVEADFKNTLLKKGKPFDASLHDDERERITKDLRNSGYYNFSKEFIYFKADSSLGNYQINDSLFIKNRKKGEESENKSADLFSVFRINNVYFRMGYDTHKALNEKDAYFSRFDTLNFGGYHFLYIDKMDVKPEVIMNSTYIKPYQIFHANLVDKTQNLLSGLKIYRFVNIRFEELNDKDSLGYRWLDCHVQLVPAKPQSYSVDLEGLNSSGNLGAGGNIEYKHKNLFHGAEEFTFKFGASVQNQENRAKEKFNTLVVGGETRIVFPKFWMPFKVEGFRTRYNPKTSLSASYNYQRRPDYTRSIANGKISYLWSPSKRVSHQVTPLSINYVQITALDSTFESSIANSYLEYSYQDHMITSASYSFVYNQQDYTKLKDFLYLNWNVEAAGNILGGISHFLKQKNDSGYYDFFGVRFAQYLQSNIDIRYHQYLNRINSMVYRFYLGVGYPYGNYPVLPFEKRYFSGGANSIRAWPVRGLGPGSYEEDDASYYNQTGDIKLEMNMEYRFKLFWVLEGAAFVDAGNVYTIRKDISPEGGLFTFDTFAEKIAVGTGLGLRFDLKYFIFRLDTGLKLRDPVKASGQRWIPTTRSYTWDDVAFNFAIGYPF